MNRLTKSCGFEDLSMGMSSDYLIAVKNFTYVRIDLVFLDIEVKKF